MLTAVTMAWRVSTIKSFVRPQLSPVETIRRRYGTLLRLPFSQSPSYATSARFATSRVLLSQPVKRPLDGVIGSWKIKYRSSSTNGSSKSPDVKSAKSNPTETVTTGATSGNPLPESNGSMTFWQKFLGPKPMPQRYTASWFREILLICTVFAITGSTTMVVRI